MTAPTVAGRYRLEAQLARGGHRRGLARHRPRAARPVALKLLRAGSDEESRERFRAEARHAGALQHPGIAAVHDFGESADGVSAWLVMELVEGEPLSAVLAREGALPVDRALDVVAQAADALQAAHALGVVHRDVKPGNLMVRPDGTVKVTDFGIARLATGPTRPPGSSSAPPPTCPPSRPPAGRSAPPPTSTRSASSPTSASPARGPSTAPPPPTSPASTCTTSRPPLPARCRRRADLVERCLEKDPADRPEDAGVVARQARALRAAAPRDAVPDGPAAPGRRVPTRARCAWPCRCCSSPCSRSAPGPSCPAGPQRRGARSCGPAAPRSRPSG